MRGDESWKLAVEGIEATQATQFYCSSRHLDAATAECDNSVPLVAGKPVALRVYPDLRKPSSWKQSVTVDGELWFLPAGTGEWQQSSRFPGIVVGRPSESVDRGSPRETLNFRIPERFASGTLAVRTRVWVDVPGSSRRSSSWSESTLSFVNTRPLHFACLAFTIAERDLILPRPTRRKPSTP